MSFRVRSFLLALGVALHGPAAAEPAVFIEKLASHYVEGPGYVTHWGGTYDQCDRRCVADQRCVMIEFYKPQKKCHLYDHTRFSGRSDAADVGMKRQRQAAAAAGPVLVSPPRIVTRAPLRQAALAAADTALPATSPAAATERTPAPPDAEPAKAVHAKPNVFIEKLAAHYVEGPGYVTHWGGTYPECEARCVADSRCVMIEFYKPQKKCHLYAHTRYSGRSNDAEVGLKRQVKPQG